MKKAAVIAGFGALAAALLLLGARGRSAPAAAGEEMVTRGELVLWSSYDGTIEARHVETVLSRYRGSATITELAAEGTVVTNGDPLARFDSSQVENERVKLAQEVARAQAELNALENAEIPLETQDLDVQLMEARFQCDTEKQFLEDSRELLAKNLVSRQEIAQQEAKVKGLEAKRSQLEERRKRTEQYLHPAKMARARADLAAAQQQLDLANQQLASCAITSPSSGVVVYNPINVGGEFRAVRVGDSVYLNQPFLYIPDMRDVMVECYVPESDLGRVQEGAEARITPLAYPDRRFRGTVESIGAMAQARPGYPAWQKYFRVAIRLDEREAGLRTGMSVGVEVLSYRKPDAVQMPRNAVRWVDGLPECLVHVGRGVEKRALKLGRGNERCFDVLRGAVPGERVVVP